MLPPPSSPTGPSASLVSRPSLPSSPQVRPCAKPHQPSAVSGALTQSPTQLMGGTCGVPSPPPTAQRVPSGKLSRYDHRWPHQDWSTGWQVQYIFLCKLSPVPRSWISQRKNMPLLLPRSDPSSLHLRSATGGLCSLVPTQLACL